MPKWAQVTAVLLCVLQSCGQITSTYKPVYTTGAAITGGGRLQTETGPLGATAAIGYTYDQLGRVTAITLKSGGSAWKSNQNTFAVRAVERASAWCSALHTLAHNFSA